MCFDIETATGRKFLLINGIRYSPDTDIGDIAQTLKAIEGMGGEEAVIRAVDDLLRKLKPETAVYLEVLQFGVRKRNKLYDVFDEAGDVIFRGNWKFMDNFVRYSSMPSDEVRWQRFAQVVDHYWEELERFGFDPVAFKTVTGLDYPDIPLDELTRGYGFAPDFNLLSDDFIQDFVYPGRGFGDRGNANIQIKMSGDYNLDFERALEEAGIPLSDCPKGKFAPAGFVWHHLDDFDPVTGTCTMQLVRKEVHSKVIKAPSLAGTANHGTEHAGACALWKRYFNIVGYRY